MLRCKRQILAFVWCILCMSAAAQIPDTVKRAPVSDSVIALVDALLSAAKDTALVVIADMAISGNRKTQPFIIEREIPFRQGDYIYLKDLQQKLVLARQQLMNTALFTDVAVYIHSQQGELVFINIDVKERWYLFPLPYFKLVDRNFNQWWVEQKASLSRVNYGIKFMMNNVTGRNDKLAINLITGYSRQIQVKYEQPNATANLKHGYSVGFNYSRQRELNYATDFSKQAFYKENDFLMQNIRGELAYFYRPAIRTRHIIKFAWINNSVNDTILKLNPNYFPDNVTRVSFPELSYTIQYLNTDYNPYPTRGVIAEASVMRRGIDNVINLTQFSYNVNYTLPVARKTSLYLQSAGVLKLPFDQPFFQQQLMGYGGPFFRGLEYYVTDGAAGIIGRATIRRQVLGITLRTPPDAKRDFVLPIRFMLKAGADAGYTYNKFPGNSLISNKMLFTQCVGLDIVMPPYDLVFRFEYSFNQLGESGLFLHMRSDF